MYERDEIIECFALLNSANDARRYNALISRSSLRNSYASLKLAQQEHRGFMNSGQILIALLMATSLRY